MSFATQTTLALCKAKITGFCLDNAIVVWVWHVFNMVTFPTILSVNHLTEWVIARMVLGEYHCKCKALILRDLAPVVRRMDSAIHWINDYPLDNAINFGSTYLLDSNLSSG